MNIAALLLCDLGAVRGPVLVGVNLVLVLVLLRLQGDRLGAGGGRPVARCLGGGVGGAFGFLVTGARLILFLRGRGEVGALLPVTGTCKYVRGSYGSEECLKERCCKNHPIRKLRLVLCR